MFKQFTSFLLSVTLVLSLCFFTPIEVSAETALNSDSESNMLSSVYKANLIEPAVITADGNITAEFNIGRLDNGDAGTVENARFTYLPTDSHPDLKLSYDIKKANEGEFKYINLSKSVFTLTGKPDSAISPGNTLGILEIADHDTIEDIALNPETRESFKYDYSYSPDTLKKAYLYWDSDNGSTLDSLLNKDVIFNPEPDFPDSDTSAHYGINHDSTETLHTKYPTDYILCDLSESPLILPNEKGKSSPLLEIN